MHEYDTTLKSLLTRPSGAFLAELTGRPVTRWLNVELAAIRHRRADLLGETEDGALIHIELQSTNHRRMHFRMLEYALAIHRGFHRFPEQILLYVGNAPLRMKDSVSTPSLSYRYRLIDIREFDAERLLASSAIEDNVMAILAHLGSRPEAVRRILNRIAARQSRTRENALGELLILSGLRTLKASIEEEIESMPILDDIMDHPILGPRIRRGMAEGQAKGLAEGQAKGLAEGRARGLAEGQARGMAEGLAEGERRAILRLIGKRFGPVPDWARRRLEALSQDDLEQIELRLLDAPTLEDIWR